jgi:hypothetical protein
MTNSEDPLAVAQDVLRGYGHDAIADALQGYQKPDEATQVTLWGGPLHGASPSMSTQPVRVEIAGRYAYVRVDDPETGKSLNFYAYAEED